MRSLHLLRYQNLDISDQLEIERDLLSHSNRNYCLINIGSPLAIVASASSSIADCIDKRFHGRIIRRSSGGGVVIVDESTIFVSFIFNSGEVECMPYPNDISKWCEAFYKSSLEINRFTLRENDYTIGDLKIGGTAQYIKKERWLHHTSFLYDYLDSNMDYLKIPKKQPTYRKNRSHGEFLGRLSRIITIEKFQESIEKGLHRRFKIHHDKAF